MWELLRLRFWPEATVATLCAVCALLRLFVRGWVEIVTGLDPDRGSGSFEWLIVLGLGLAAALLGVAARHEWRLSRAAAATSD